MPVASDVTSYRSGGQTITALYAGDTKVWPTQIEPPTNFVGTISGLNNVLTWTDSAALDETGYNIYWSTTDLTDWTTGTLLVSALPPGVQTATHMNGQMQGTVYYGIVARRGNDSSPWVETVVLGAPLPPSDFVGETVAGDNVLTWTDSITADATGYDIYWSITSLTDWTTGTLLANVAPGVQTATHVGGEALGPVLYGITTRRGTESSMWVSTAVYLVFLRPPTLFLGDASGDDNVLTWTDSISPDETGYDIYWSPTDLVDWTTGTFLANIAPGVQTATHVGGQLQGSLYYGLATRRGAEISTWVEKFIRADIEPPTNFVGVESANTLTDDNVLTWTDSTTPGVIGYDIYWDDVDRVDWVTLGALLGTVGPGVQTITHTDAQVQGKKLYYGIAAKKGTDLSFFVETSVAYTAPTYGDAGTFTTYGQLHAGARMYLSIMLDIDPIVTWVAADDTLYIDVAGGQSGSLIGWSIIIYWPGIPYPEAGYGGIMIGHPDPRDPSPYPAIREDGYAAVADIGGRISSQWMYWTSPPSSTTANNWGSFQLDEGFPNQPSISGAVPPATGYWVLSVASYTPWCTITGGRIQAGSIRATFLQRVTRDAGLSDSEDSAAGDVPKAPKVVLLEPGDPTPEGQQIPVVNPPPEVMAQDLLREMKTVQANLDQFDLSAEDLTNLESHIGTLETWIANPITTPPWLLAAPPGVEGAAQTP